MEIWSSQIAVAAKAMGKIGVTEKNIAAIGIYQSKRNNDRLGEGNRKAGIQCDRLGKCRRTAEKVEELVKDGFGEKSTKNRTDPRCLFSATKLAWILDHIEQGRERAKMANCCLEL